MVYILLATGFEEMEAIAPLDILRRAGIPAATVGVNGEVITGGHGIAVTADMTISQMDLTDMDMIVLPGGLGGVASILASQQALDAVTFAWENGRYVAAICAAPTILSRLHITDGKTVVCYPGCEAEMENIGALSDLACVQDGKVITGTSAGCATAFGLALVAALKTEAAAKEIAAKLVIR